jgi:ABC-2 type transport system ATP-binding protein
LLDVVRHPRGGTRVHALRNLHFQVDRGTVLGLLGPNGAGKTTLIKILASLVLPTAGTVQLGGFDVVRASLRARRQVGYVPSDERSFFWRLSGRENLRFFANLHEVETNLATARIGAFLDMFALAGVADDRFGTYSSGVKKLFTIGRALIPAPPILVLDEPTNSLDPLAGGKLMRYVREELAGQRGCTVIWATHRLEEVQEICDEVLLIHRGETRFHGTIPELLAAHAGDEVGARRTILTEVFEQLVSE